jgi:hypothetical protein
MPAQQRIGLDDEERLFPAMVNARKQDQEHPVRPGTRWALHLTVKDDQLLAKQRVFGEKFSPGAG